MIMPPMYGFWATQPANPRTFDPEKAKSLLDAAGYQVGSDGIRTTKDGKQLQLRLMGRSDSHDSKKVVEFVKGYLNDVGIDVEGLPHAAPTRWARRSRPASTTCSSGAGSPTSTRTTSCRSSPATSGPGTTTVARRPTTCPTRSTATRRSTRCTRSRRQETDRDARKAITDQMQQMIYEDTPYVLTYYYDSLEAYRSDQFTDFTPQPAGDGALFLQFGTWSYQSVKPVSEAAAEGDGTTTPTAAESSSEPGPHRRHRRGGADRVGGVLVWLSRRRTGCDRRRPRVGAADGAGRRARCGADPGRRRGDAAR